MHRADVIMVGKAFVLIWSRWTRWGGRLECLGLHLPGFEALPARTSSTLSFFGKSVG